MRRPPAVRCPPRSGSAAPADTRGPWPAATGTAASIPRFAAPTAGAGRACVRRLDQPISSISKAVACSRSPSRNFCRRENSCSDGTSHSTNRYIDSSAPARPARTLADLARRHRHCDRWGLRQAAPPQSPRWSRPSRSAERPRSSHANSPQLTPTCCPACRATRMSSAQTTPRHRLLNAIDTALSPDGRRDPSPGEHGRQSDEAEPGLSDGTTSTPERYSPNTDTRMNTPKNHDLFALVITISSLLTRRVSSTVEGSSPCKANPSQHVVVLLLVIS